MVRAVDPFGRRERPRRPGVDSTRPRTGIVASSRGRALFERDLDLERVDDVLAASRGGHGGLVRIDGAAGLGKTQLLAEVVSRANGSGMTVLAATGGEFERSFPFGVVRQLFERRLAEMSSRTRRALLSDGAALSGTLFRGGPPEDSTADQSCAVVHGLYWLTAKLAARLRLALVVDDAHWADPPSLRFATYLGRRLDDLPVVLVIASRPNEPGADPALEQLWGEVEPTLAIELAALTPKAVAVLVRQTLEPTAGIELCRACHSATAGNPFYLRELVGALLERREGSVWSPEEIGQMTTEGISRDARRRLTALGRDAEALARALAILGPGAELRDAALVAELGLGAVAAAADALRAVGILSRQDPDFAHPIVRNAVIAGLAPGVRAGLHARAADQLAGGGADPVKVARHLLEAEPAGRPEVAAGLRAAARQSIAAGAPGAAVAFLRRAKREPPSPADQQTLLFELGHAEVLDRDPAAQDHLSTAFRLTADRAEAGRIALLLADVLFYSGSVGKAIDVADTAIARLADRDAQLAARLAGLAAWWTTTDARFAADREPRLSQLATIAEAGGPGVRTALVVLGSIAGLRTGRSTDVLPLVSRGLDNGGLLTDETSDSQAVFLAIAALSMVDALDELERLLDEIQRDARRRSSVLGHTIAAGWRGYAQLRRGHITAALDDLRLALALAEEHQLRIALPAVLAWWAQALHEAGDPDHAAAALDKLDLGELEHSTSGCILLHSRAMLRAGLGRRDEAADDLRRCGATMDAVDWRSPVELPWRSTLAGIIASNEPAEARALVAEELGLARLSDQPRAIGRALRALALLHQPVDIDALGAAVMELERSPAELELARALTDLGAALRRANRAGDAREPLRRALDLAHRGGAVAAASRAREELIAAGGRPRRMAARGADALTPSERRVCRFATQGLSNPEIAQTLFVSRKAIEMHLSNAYRKLDIHSRAELVDALEPSEPSATAQRQG